MKKSRRYLASFLAIVMVLTGFIPSTFTAKAANYPNLITNGTFDSATGWTISDTAHLTLADGKLNMDGAEADWASISQTVTVKKNTYYHLSFDMKLNTVGQKIKIYGAIAGGRTGEDNTWIADDKYGTEVHYEYPSYVTFNSGDNTSMDVTFECPASTKPAGYIDNVSLVESDKDGVPIDVSTVAPTVVPTVAPTGPAPDPSVVVQNSDFTTTDFWTLPAGVTISDGVCNLSGTQADWSEISQDVTVKANTLYMISLDYKVSAGRFQVYLLDPDDTNPSTCRLGGDTYTSGVSDVPTNTWTTFTYSGNSGLGINSGDNTTLRLVIASPNGSFKPIGALDKVTLTEITTNPGGGDPEVDPSVIVQNGKFDTADFWTIPTGATIAKGKLTVDGTQPAWSEIKQEVIVKPDTIYKITMDLNLTAGRFQVYLIDADGIRHGQDTYTSKENEAPFVGKFTFSGYNGQVIDSEDFTKLTVVISSPGAPYTPVGTIDNVVLTEVLPTATPTPTQISKATVTAIADQFYTGKALIPTLTVKYGTKTLAKNTDYTVAYKANTVVGKASVTITGKGKYTGTKVVYFNIIPSIAYTAQFQSTTFTATAKNGATCESSKPTMKSIKMVLSGAPKTAHIKYQIYQNKKWSTVASDNKAIGLADNKAITESIRITVSGLKGRSVMYRVSVNGVWTDWYTVKNDVAITSAAAAGKINSGKAIDGIQVKLK